MTEPDDAIIEKCARALIIGCKGDPDMTVQLGTPQVYGTPSGEVFAVTPGAGVPLWRMYKTMARSLLGMATAILTAPEPQTKGTTVDQLSAELAGLGVNQPNTEAA